MNNRSVNSTTRQLRIAVISNYFAPHAGGAENQNHLIGKALVSRGHHVTVLTRRFHPRLPAHEIIDGLNVRRIRPYGHSVLAQWLMNFGTAWHYGRMRRTFR